MNGNHLWNVLGWVAAALNVVGNLALTTKSVHGWVIRLVSNACWLPYGIVTGAWAITANHALFVLINGYGWWKWTREAKLVVASVPCPAGECPSCETTFRQRFDGKDRRRWRHPPGATQ